ncbi:MAG: cardiolipin synthase [Candidatus Cloacimonetes bacterium]|nr:cardiolipin synthase [Candidatus Cloacimonadota bacterium]
MTRKHLLTDIVRITAIIIVAAVFLSLILYSFLAKDTSPYLHSAKVLRNIINAVTAIFVISVIILENSNSSRTLAWILTIIFIPVGGMILYLFFGRNHKRRKMYLLKEISDNREMVSLLESNIYQSNRAIHYLTEAFQIKIAKLLINNSKAFLSFENHLEIYQDGVETFRSIHKQLKLAKHHIHMEYFSISDDETGRAVKDILIKKALEGVEIRLIIDFVGSFFLKKEFIKELLQAGVKVKKFSPTVFPYIHSRLNYRNHRKIIVIDGLCGFVGGLNIGDSYVGKNKYFGYWRDTHLMLNGEAVKSLQAIFMMDWLFVTKEKLFELEYFPQANIVNYSPVQIVSSGPDSDWDSIMQVYFSMIAGASSSIKITSPYLVLDESLKMSIKTAALSGLDVQIIIPGKADHQIVYWGTQSYIEELLEAGVKIYSYKKGFIHAKVLIADEVCASVGTANMDIRSFKHNFEVNAILYGREAVHLLTNQFKHDLRDSEQIVLEHFEKRSSISRVRESVSRLFAPLL